MRTHEGLKSRALTKPEVAEAYAAQEEEYALLHELLAARAKQGLTQADAVERMHTNAPPWRE